jgi:hypothetical protein
MMALCACHARVPWLQQGRRLAGKVVHPFPPNTLRQKSWQQGCRCWGELLATCGSLPPLDLFPVCWYIAQMLSCSLLLWIVLRQHPAACCKAWPDFWLVLYCCNKIAESEAVVSVSGSKC